MEDFRVFLAEANETIQRARDFYIRINNIEADIGAALANYNASVANYNEADMGTVVNLETTSEALGTLLNTFISLRIPALDYGIVIRAKKEKLVLAYNHEIFTHLENIEGQYNTLIQDITRKYDEALEFMRVSNIMTDFRDIVLHPRGNINFENITRHRMALLQLIELRRQTCAFIPNPDPAHIYDELSRITYNNTNADSQLYTQITCDVMNLLRKNTHSFMVGNLIGLPVESMGIQLDLRQNRVISDTSVEGVVWTVGYGGRPEPFATMKYAKPPLVAGTPKNHNMLHELVIGFVLNTIRNLTPNFMYIWAGFSCNIPREGAPRPPPPGAVAGVGGSVLHEHDFGTLCNPNRSETMETIVLSEAIEVYGSFADLIATYNADPLTIRWVDVVGVVFQILASLSIAQTSFRFVHGDLHGGNVLIKRLAAPVNIVYNLGGRDFTIPTRYIPIIIDYGFARLQYNGITLTPLIYGWNGQQVYGQGMPMAENYQINPRVFMPLYDVARLLQLVNGMSPKFTALDRVLTNGLPIPTITGLRNEYHGDPSVYECAVPDPVRVMAINLYESSRRPRGILEA